MNHIAVGTVLVGSVVDDAGVPSEDSAVDDCDEVCDEVGVEVAGAVEDVPLVVEETAGAAALLAAAAGGVWGS